MPPESTREAQRKTGALVSTTDTRAAPVVAHADRFWGIAGGGGGGRDDGVGAGAGGRFGAAAAAVSSVFAATEGRESSIVTSVPLPIVGHAGVVDATAPSSVQEIGPGLSSHLGNAFMSMKTFLQRASCLHSRKHDCIVVAGLDFE